MLRLIRKRLSYGLLAGALLASASTVAMAQAAAPAAAPASAAAPAAAPAAGDAAAPTGEYANSPFTDWTVEISQAWGLEMARARVALVAAVAPPVDPDLIEVVEQMAKSDWDRFGGTLTERNPQLAQQLHDTLSAFEEGMEEGDDMRSLVPQAQTLLQQAYDVVIDPAISSNPAFKAAVMQQLALGEGGVSEGPEEADGGEVFAYSLGWATWQSVKAIWADIATGANAEQTDEANQVIGVIDGVYTQPLPPDPWLTMDPEVTESPANQLVSIAEALTNSNLYPGRDLAGLADHLSQTILPACDAYDAGNDDVALERVIAVHDGATNEVNGMADLLDLFDEDLSAQLTAQFGKFIVAYDDDDDDSSGAAPAAGAAAGSDDAAAYVATVAAMSNGDACRAISTSLQTAKTEIGD